MKPQVDRIDLAGLANLLRKNAVHVSVRVARSLCDETFEVSLRPCSGLHICRCVLRPENVSINVLSAREHSDHSSDDCHSSLCARQLLDAI